MRALRRSYGRPPEIRLFFAADVAGFRAGLRFASPLMRGAGGLAYAPVW